ncbi:MAG TPA: DEAD/DEAH box helicase [Chthoniobacterales bacterium]|jgi:RecG-like helicase/REP element-mobilizing transposase RayT|nr:DEAD/DEAH box helicase [Chthoniobacterales bacterium]
MSLDLHRPLGEIDWIPRPRSTQLRRLGIETVGDLLTHYPRRYEDRREFAAFPRDESEQPICLCGEVIKTRFNRFGRGKKIFEATLQEDGAHALSQPLVLRWFNLHYVQKMILTGQRLVVFGKPRQRGQRLCMEHPEFEVIENDEEISIHFRRITPIYPATEGLSQRALRGLVYRLLQQCDEFSLTTILPEKLATGLTPRSWREIHFPESENALAEAREAIVLAEFFTMQMLLASRRARTRARSGVAHSASGQLLERFLRQLPFDLTNAQTRVIEELRADLAAPIPMNRLLQGDVGSGKTVVAIAAMLLAVEAGFQAALMAPTQILAEQHYAVLQRWLEPLGVAVSLRTSARKEDPLPLFARTHASPPGSARVPRAGDGVPPSRTFPDRKDRGGAQYHRRHLPHFEKPWAIYAVTIGTKSRRALSPESRTIVLDALRHFHTRRYELCAACVMPDHVHLLIQPWPKGEDSEGSVGFWSLSELLRSIKSFSAREINKRENATGGVWEREQFDRYIRSDRDLEEKFHYILRNPWESKIARPDEDYPWVWTQEDEAHDTKSSSRWHTATSTQNACATLGRRAGQIFVGTHALLYEPEGLENPGLVVIDEQHKFGVAQRARLTSQEPAPDVLVMTATPIPRTLTMSLYGDLDVSTIEEMPADRGRIVTAARDEEKLPEVLAFLRRELEAGRQAYIVYPLIDESEKLEAKAAAAEFEKWRQRLEPFTCELLHGRVPAPEKQAIMERFRRGLTSALVSTTVIEVGVDVPNASVMLIENAERFGLAQLHQLRGRIGRGEHKSFCILLRSDPSPETIAKLAVLEKTSNGFAVAEADWELRGPGDLLGTAQSGLPALKLGNLRADAKLMQRARAVALEIFHDDPELARPENQRFRHLVVEDVGKTFSHVS